MARPNDILLVRVLVSIGLCYVGRSVYFVDDTLVTCALVTDVLVYVWTNSTV